MMKESLLTSERNFDGAAASEFIVKHFLARDYMTEIQQLIVSLKANDLRPGKEFMGINNSELNPYNVPISLGQFNHRIRSNFSYFKLNYLTIFGIILCLSIIMNPLSIICILLIVGGWYYKGQDIIYTFNSPVVQQIILPMGIVTTSKTITLIALITVIVVAVFIFASVFIWTVFIGGLITFIHASLRNPIAIREVEDVEEGIGSFDQDYHKDRTK